MESSRLLGLALAALLTITTAEGRPLHYGAIDDPALARCDDLEWRGDREQSAPCYRDILASAAAEHIRAEAAWALGDLHEANRLFQSAAAAAPDDANVRTRWGNLYADTHQDAEAMKLYREALAADSQHAFAMLGAAQLLVGGFNDAANEFLEPLLTNATLADGARLGAWLLVARIALENQDADEATHNLGEAAALIESNQWPPLELYALRAAAALVENRDGGEWTERSLAYNPSYGSVFATPAYFYVISRRYRQAIDLYQRAVDIEPSLASAHEELGVNLLRDNQLERARQHLEQAHEHDPFSPVAVNTLRLLDSFDNFVVIEDSAPANGASQVPLILRLHREEAAAIAPYATEMARRSIREFTERYDYTLSEPVIIEMYPDHEDFAVRTAGMPGIGILGATFGYVVAMDSPSARSTDHFQWGTTLWHEMAHVFTLEATSHLVPRWFSEGISVYEEWLSGPTPGIRVPMSVYGAMRDDKFLPVATLDEGFIRPSYPDQVIVSYMQAGLICRFIGETYGQAKLAELLAAFGEGLDTASAIRKVLDVSAPAFDREFSVYIEEEHGPVLASLDDWHETYVLLSAAHAAQEFSQVIDIATTLIDMHPGYVEADSPYIVLANAHETLGNRDAAKAALMTYHERGGFDPNALKQLAAWQVEADDQRAAAATLQTVAMVQPLDEELHQQLGTLRLNLGDARAALREFDILLQLEPHDKATAYLRVAEAQRALGDIDASRASVLTALDLAPSFRPAQRLLLELQRTTNSN